MSSVEPEHMLLHYRIINKVGEGGMGQVYRAEDTKLGRYVAIKLLAPDATRDQTAKRRLLAEAQSASVLNHPNIVTIHAIEEVDGVDFIVMEFVEGETLTSYLATNGALQLTSLLDVGIQVADALEAAHSVGLIHRDIKPANILITPKGVAKVADFGLAKMVRFTTDEIDREALTLAANLTGPGIVLGTPHTCRPSRHAAKRSTFGPKSFHSAVCFTKPPPGRAHSLVQARSRSCMRSLRSIRRHRADCAPNYRVSSI